MESLYGACVCGVLPGFCSFLLQSSPSSAVSSLSAVSSENLDLYPASQSSDTHPSHLLSPSPSDIGSYMPAQMVSTAQ